MASSGKTTKLADKEKPKAPAQRPQASSDKNTIKAKFEALYKEFEEKYLDDDDFYKNKLTEKADAKFQEFTQLATQLATPENSSGIMSFVGVLRNLNKAHKKFGTVAIFAMHKNIPLQAALLLNQIQPADTIAVAKEVYKQTLKVFFDQATCQTNDKELFAVVKIIKEHMPVMSAMTQILRAKFPKDNIPQDCTLAWKIPNVHLASNTPGFEGHYAQFQIPLTESKASDYMAALGQKGYHGKIQTGSDGSLLAIPNLSQYNNAKLENKIKNTQEDVSLGVIRATLQLKTGMEWNPKNSGKNMVATCTKEEAIALLQYFNKFSLKPQFKPSQEVTGKFELCFTDIKQEALDKLPFLKDFQQAQTAPKTESTKAKAEKKAEPSVKGKKIITIFGEDYEPPKTLEMGDVPPKLGSTKPVELKDALPLLGLKTWNESLQISEEDIAQVRSPDMAYGESINPYTLRNLVADAKKVRDEKLAFCKLGEKYEPFCRMGQEIKEGELVAVDLCLLGAKEDPNAISYQLRSPENKEEEKGYRYPQNVIACIQPGVEAKRTTDAQGKPTNVSLDDFACSNQVKRKVVTTNVFSKTFDYLGYPIVAYFASRNIKEGERISESLHADVCIKQNQVPTFCDATGKILEDANIPLEVEVRFPDAECKAHFPRKFQRQKLVETVETRSVVGVTADELKEYSLLYFWDDIREALTTPQWWIEPKHCWRLYKVYTVDPNCNLLSLVKPSSPMLRTLDLQQFEQMQFDVPAKSELPNKNKAQEVIAMVAERSSSANTETKVEVKAEIKNEMKDATQGSFTWRYERLTNRLWCFAADRNDVITRSEYLFSKALKVHPTQPGLTLDGIPMVLIDEPITDSVRQKLQSCLPAQEWGAVSKILQTIPAEVVPVDVVYPPLVELTTHRMVQVRTHAASPGGSSVNWADSGINGVNGSSAISTQQPR